MNQRMKKAVAAVCVGTLALTFAPATAMAEPVTGLQENLIAPHMQYIESAQSNLTISGTTATVEASVQGDYYDATKAKVIAELQVQNGSSWIPVKIWTVTENDFEAYVDEEYPVVEGHTYRVKATVTVWEGSLSETQVVYSN